MKVACGFDHAGIGLRDAVFEAIEQAGHIAIDLGVDSPEPVDYPDTARAVADRVVTGEAERGLAVCGSGAGVSIAASKFPGIRAAVIHDTYTAHQAVEHDDLNVLCLGARVIGPAIAEELIHAFLNAEFTGEERHVRRVGKILAIEEEFARES